MLALRGRLYPQSFYFGGASIFFRATLKPPWNSVADRHPMDDASSRDGTGTRSALERGDKETPVVLRSTLLAQMIHNSG
jgi:hypothetical protein